MKKMNGFSRRDLLTGGAALAAVSLASGIGGKPALAVDAPKSEFKFCLNMSTIRGQKKTMVEDVEIAAKAGYQAIEPWIGKCDEFVKGGGVLKDLGKRVSDLGMTVEDVIGFPEWIVDDDVKRAKALEEAKRCMDIAQQLGCKRMAAPPAGAVKLENINLIKAAERYRALIEVGEKMDVTPMVELWGFSKTLGRLGETALVALESGHPKACILPDVYHLFKGGSDFNGIKLLSQSAVPVFHLNDYPKDLTREKIGDKDRVYPGDGIAPFKDLFKDLRAIGFKGVLSLELFNPEYWKLDAFEVAKTGLEKMKAVAAE